MRNEARAAMRAGTVEQINEEVGGFDLPESDSKDFHFKSIFTGDGFKKTFGKLGMRNLVIVLSVLLNLIIYFVPTIHILLWETLIHDIPELSDYCKQILKEYEILTQECDEEKQEIQMNM